MTDTQTPADPSAYRVTFTRNASGSLTHVEVFKPGTAAKPEFWTYRAEDLDELIACAREEERGAPDDRLPSDRAFICAVLRANGLPILGEQDEDDDDGAASEARIQHAMAFGLEPPEEAPHLDPQDEDQGDDDEGDDWRDVLLLVQVDGAEDRLVFAGAFADANADEPGLEPTLRDLVRGGVDWCRFGGGAAPMVQVVCALEAPGLDAVTLDAIKRTIAKADALDALLAAAREAEAFMAGFEGDEAQDPPVDDRLAALRAAIAKAEGGAS